MMVRVTCYAPDPRSTCQNDNTLSWVAYLISMPRTQKILAFCVKAMPRGPLDSAPACTAYLHSRCHVPHTTSYMRVVRLTVSGDVSRTVRVQGS